MSLDFTPGTAGGAAPLDLSPGDALDARVLAGWLATSRRYLLGAGGDVVRNATHQASSRLDRVRVAVLSGRIAGSMGGGSRCLNGC